MDDETLLQIPFERLCVRHQVQWLNAYRRLGLQRIREAYRLADEPVSLSSIPSAVEPARLKRVQGVEVSST